MTPETTDRLLGLIPQLYEAPGTTHGWQVFVERLRRERRGGSFEESDAEVLRLLVPHVRRALELHRRLLDADATTDGLAAAVNTSQAASWSLMTALT